MFRPVIQIALLLALHGIFAQAQYFPESALGSKAEARLKSNWYTSQLRGFEEPSLFALTKTPGVEAYRFLWLRSFHHPIAVRLIVRSDGSSVLTKKIASGAGGFRPGTVVEISSRPLTIEQTQAFLTKIHTEHFWTLANPVNDQRGTDGSQWILEGVKKGHYHLVDRWSPEEGAVREIGAMLALELAHISVPENEIY